MIPYTTTLRFHCQEGAMYKPPCAWYTQQGPSLGNSQARMPPLAGAHKSSMTLAYMRCRMMQTSTFIVMMSSLPAHFRHLDMFARFMPAGNERCQCAICSLQLHHKVRCKLLLNSLCPIFLAVIAYPCLYSCHTESEQSRLIAESSGPKPRVKCPWPAG